MTAHTIVRTVLLPALLVASSAAVDHTEDTKPADLSRYEGTWMRVDREVEDAARSAEIERVTANLPFVARGAVRLLMRRKRKMLPPERCRITAEDGVLAIQDDDQVASRFILDGEQRPGGEDLLVRSWLEAGVVKQSWRQGADTDGSTVWRLPDGGAVLKVERRSTIQRLKEPRDTRRPIGAVGNTERPRPLLLGRVAQFAIRGVTANPSPWATPRRAGRARARSAARARRP